MPRFHKIFLFLLLTALLASPRPASAALIPRYDLESLCYMSTDVVEATLTRQHKAGQEEWNDRFTATVTRSLIGEYHSGDKIAALDLFLYDPNETGQHCILFIARKEFHYDVEPSKTIAPQAVDMLLIDSQEHVQRYYQMRDPGGLSAGRVPNPPVLAEERREIALEWVIVDRLRLLLSRQPRSEDVPVLQSLLHQRRDASGPGLRNVVAEIARERLASLHVSTD